MDSEIKKLYEDIRIVLLQTENISYSIKGIRYLPAGQAGNKLREVLTEMLRTCQADLLILLDFILEAENCQTSYELDELLSSYSDPESEKVN